MELEKPVKIKDNRNRPTDYIMDYYKVRINQMFFHLISMLNVEVILILIKITAVHGY